MLNWCNRFNICAFLDNHHYQLPGHTYECLVGCGTVDAISASAGTALQQWQQWQQTQNDWCFGHFAYDLKNEIENLTTVHPDRIGFPHLYFFVPRYVFQLQEKQITIGSLEQDHATVFESIRNDKYQTSASPLQLNIRERISKQDYIEAIESIRQRILRGDCYELNYCMEFYDDAATIQPQQVYHQLTELSPNPFSVFYKVNESHLLCASPERFLRKKGKQLLSQPIKGTVRRNLNDAAADEALKKELFQSSKDRSENVMVVDLVRNDLSRVCVEGSVTVDELYGIYSFPQVHQMISTVSGEMKDDVLFADIIRSVFPMGSMTGAPKRRVMELIDAYEQSARGLYSGAVGYITPEGDFDFNVVIRSILYNQTDKYLSYQVGGGITFYSDPENEYEECLLKASAIRRILSGDQ